MQPNSPFRLNPTTSRDFAFSCLVAEFRVGSHLPRVLPREAKAKLTRQRLLVWFSCLGRPSIFPWVSGYFRALSRPLLNNLNYFWTTGSSYSLV